MYAQAMTQSQPDPFAPDPVAGEPLLDAEQARTLRLVEAEATLVRVAKLLPKWERAAATTHMQDGAKHVMVQVTDELRAVLNGAEPVAPVTPRARY